MLFGEVDDDVIELRMYGNDIKQVSEIRYLSVLLNHQLFSLHVDYMPIA